MSSQLSRAPHPTVSETRKRVRAALRDRIDGERILGVIEEVLERLMRGDEPLMDLATRQSTYIPLSRERVAAYKTVLDVQLRLLSKVLPDLKAVEMSGPDGERLKAGSTDRLVLATKLLAIMRETGAAEQVSREVDFI